MQMKTREFIKNEWYNLLVLLMPILLIAYFWDKFPAEIPLYWNLNVHADKYPKVYGLIAGISINILLYLLIIFLPIIDPKKENYKLFSITYKQMKFGLNLF